MFDELHYTIEVKDEDLGDDNSEFQKKLLETVMKVSVDVKRVYGCDLPNEMYFSGRLGKNLYNCLTRAGFKPPNIKLLFNEKTSQNEISIRLDRKVSVKKLLTDEKPQMEKQKNRPNGMGSGTILPGLITQPPPGTFTSSNGILMEKDVYPEAIIKLIKK